MSSQTYLRVSYPAKCLWPLRDSARNISVRTTSLNMTSSRMGTIITKACRYGVALALIMPMLGQSTLFAQGWPQSGPYYGQYAPAPQSSYAQQSYGPGQSYGPQAYPAPGQTYPPQGFPPQQRSYAQQPYAQPYTGSNQGYAQPGYGQQGYSQPQGYVQSQAYATAQGQALGAPQLEQLAAPIALYPDTLVAQVLAASTYPAQVVEADRWLQAQGNASPYDIAGGADAQNWDPSVKALTAFPQVLAEMDRNFGWTTDLGNAYYNQPQDLLNAVQVLRQRAQAAGNLQSTPQEAVSYDQGAIELAPPNPQLVYVPAYNPWTVYGDPVTPYPGFSLIGALGSFFSSAFNSTMGSSAIRYGLGIAISAFTHTTWGWLGWGLSWLSHAILFNHSTYATHSATVADWGLPQGGPRWFAGQRTAGGVANNSYRMASNYARPPTRPAIEAYNRAPAPIARSQQSIRPSYSYGNSGAGYSNAASSGAGNGVRAGSVYRGQLPGNQWQGNTQQAYRTPSPGLPRGDYEGRAAGSLGSGYAGQSFAGSSGKEARSGGFHLFGGGNEARLTEPKFKEPKYSEPRFKEPKFSEPKFKEPKFKEPKEPKMSAGHSGGGHGSGKHHG
jgi:Protein of unknown function (DUF3300)